MVVREPERSWWEQVRSPMTVAAVREADAARHLEAVASGLAELAAEEELLVVLGTDARTSPHGLATSQPELAVSLRHRLPRHEIVSMTVRSSGHELLRDAATVEEFLNAGRLPVVSTPVAALPDVTGVLTSYLQADRVLRVVCTGTGVNLCPVWRRSLAGVN